MPVRAPVLYVRVPQLALVGVRFVHPCRVVGWVGRGTSMSIEEYCEVAREVNDEGKKTQTWSKLASRTPRRHG